MEFNKLHQTIHNQLIIEKIIGIPISNVEVRDEIYWGLINSGTFSIQSVMALIQGLPVDNRQPWEFKWIWAIDTMPKIKIFLWQLCHNALPIRGALFRRGCNVDPQCPLCSNDIETIEHLLWVCPSTNAVWNLAAQHNWIPQLQFNCITEWGHYFGSLHARYNGKFVQRITFLLWGIWKTRNGVIFQNEAFNPMKCLVRAKNLSAQWRI